jgi:hypothetical protein
VARLCVVSCLLTVLLAPAAVAHSAQATPARVAPTAVERVDLARAGTEVFGSGISAVTASRDSVRRGVVLAQYGQDGTGQLTQVLTNIRNWLLGMLVSLATLFLTIGGVRYLLAGGDPGEVDAAKRAFKSAAIGYAMAALAPALVSILRSLVGA